jgi:hypothetical protein
MIEEKLGYKFNNENGATAVQAQLKVHFGLPVTPTSITTEWVSVHTAIDADTNKQIWYVLHDDSLPPILGGAETFNIIVEDII